MVKRAFLKFQILSSDSTKNTIRECVQEIVLHVNIMAAQFHFVPEMLGELIGSLELAHNSV